ncbi:Jag N-terminal domain-containing protein [Helicobacter canadensis]|uniref:RNA-binding protein KhpB N-terminal domain-containing protein n=1 Tax=Helicobacter canadensis MIT 98-5491 TaxID=537970 RepID=C5ZXJ1_9HELI|nr:Jag N-terminal domain-containing protein [Helicobacter canadensis]EES89859.1 conserved hypothetical protein [Helicobacter canadensis MIT 98-5491]EFR48659.1 hypothetical protein HCMG_00832 [Helicobacter canadensis MIT 98-5491]STO99901.1 VirB11-interacting protein [Helicobacter canadensis]
MKKIEAATLEDALIEASKLFNCSIVDLEYEIIQNPQKGFLGFGKKNAIICAQPKTKQTPIEQTPTPKTQAISQKESPKDLNQISIQVQKELQELLQLLPYSINEVIVKPYDENTLYIKIDGEDSALLIGKEGYRYKAFSYLIFNWINHIYGLMVRLEIAEFLKNQEEMIANHLIPVIENIKTYGKAQTKPLDGVLAHIALKQLREQFPDKYISFRINQEGQKYIIINEFQH